MYSFATTVTICHTIQKCRTPDDDVTIARAGQKKNPRPGQCAIVCERKWKEYVYQGRADVVSTDSRPEAKPNIRQLLYLTFIRYSQEVHELNPLQAGHIFLPSHKSYLKNYGTDLNSVLPLVVYIQSRRESFIYHPSNKRKSFYSNETIHCTENI